MKEYNRNNALKYARDWAYARNPAYFDFSDFGGDCTNFISQCLFAGGMPMNYTPVYGWFYKSSYSRSASWSGVEYLYNFLISGGNRPGPAAKIVQKNELVAGDIIQLSFDGKNFSHSLLVVESNNTGIYIATHTYDTYGKSLDDYFYNSARYLHILGAN